jgi:hypothetical protein
MENSVKLSFQLQEAFFKNALIKKSIKLTDGHLHLSIKVEIEQSGQSFLLQRINTAVFSNFHLLNDNLRKILHTLSSSKEYSKLAYIQRLVETKDGKDLFIDSENYVWRCFEFISNSTAFDIAPNIAVIENGAFLAGLFINSINSNNLGEPLHLNEVLPNFQNLSGRFTTLNEIFTDSRYNLHRKSDSESLLDKINQLREKLITTLDFFLNSPLRLCHNDFKLNNLLFHKDTYQALAVVDLDSCMSGRILYDFGDLVRSFAASFQENEEDERKCVPSWENFYRASLAFKKGALQNGKERFPELLNEATFFMPALIALVLGVRFLSDYLTGDTYFPVTFSGENYLRARNQVAYAENLICLVESRFKGLV